MLGSSGNWEQMPGLPAPWVHGGVGREGVTRAGNLMGGGRWGRNEEEERLGSQAPSLRAGGWGHGCPAATDRQSLYQWGNRGQQRAEVGTASHQGSAQVAWGPQPRGGAGD